MKKLLCSLLMLTCAFGITACSSEAKTLSYDEDVVKTQCETIFAEVSADFTDEEYEMITSYNDYQLENVSDNFYQSYGIHVSGDTLISAIDSYRDSLEDLGTVTATDEFDFTAKEDELIVTYYLNGSIHDGSIEYIYDKNLTLTSITTNIKNTFSECMQKAGINTLIGMGTVFVMLIVIMFIIMLLSLIPKLFEKKDKTEEVKKDSVDKAIEGIVAREEAESDETDDLELVAVIAAAIASYEGTSTDAFVVRSIKRIK